MPGTGGASGDATGTLGGSGGGSGGTGAPVGGICWTDPSDMAGQVDSLLERVSRLEEVLSLLCGMDITAVNLSDISALSGTLEQLAATISNASLGWTNTIPPPAGTSLSSLGWTMADGSTFPVVVMDEDGVLQFGFGGVDSNGDAVPVAGEYLTTLIGGGGGVMDYAITSWRTGDGSYSDNRGITITDAAPTSGEGDAKLTVAQNGIYLVTGSAAWFLGSLTVYSGTLRLFTPYPEQDTSDTKNTDADAAPILTWKIQKLLNLSAGDLIELEIDVTPTGSGGALQSFEFSAVRLTDN